MCYSSMQELGGSGACPPPSPRNFLRIDGTILQFRDIYFYSACRYFIKDKYSSTACVKGKVSVGSDNHMMQHLAISVRLACGVQHRFTIWLILYIRVPGGDTPEAVRFL